MATPGTLSVQALPKDTFARALARRAGIGRDMAAAWAFGDVFGVQPVRRDYGSISGRTQPS